MRYVVSTLLALVCFLFLSGWGHTSRAYTVTHERLVEAALQALSEEAFVKIGDIEQCDESNKNGKVTLLKAPYIHYSKIEVRIDSRDSDSCPKLKVKITTNTVFFTRHKEWEQRIHELTLLKLRARQHGLESKPTALPPTARGPAAPPPPPAPAPQK
ncbi:MAG TPA: hypothetical protein VEK08_22760 [Planctomycetota bacterium]|nr:hypothetical protein [Planctomycetota bacterium]